MQRLAAEQQAQEGGGPEGRRLKAIVCLQRLAEDLLLADYTKATRASYLLSTRQLFDWLPAEPEQWQEDDIRGYFLHRRAHNDDLT